MLQPHFWTFCQRTVGISKHKVVGLRICSLSEWWIIYYELFGHWINQWHWLGFWLGGQESLSILWTDNEWAHIQSYPMCALSALHRGRKGDHRKSLKNLLVRHVDMLTGSGLYIFHHHLLCPGGYAEIELIHSACVHASMGEHVCWCVSRGSGGSSVQHVPGKVCHHLCEEWSREGEESGEGKGRAESRWRNIRGGQSYKKRREEGEYEG